MSASVGLAHKTDTTSFVDEGIGQYFEYLRDLLLPSSYRTSKWLAQLIAPHLCQSDSNRHSNAYLLDDPGLLPVLPI